MTLAADYQALGLEILARVELPPVERIYLPPAVEHAEFRDEFGFVFLADGSAGPFYTSLPGELAALWRLLPDRGQPVTLAGLLAGFTSGVLARRALALGAFNAIGQHLFRRSGLDLRSGADARAVGLGAGRPEPGEWVGMVGWFRPLIEQLNADGVGVLVLERLPERVVAGPGVRLTEDPADLAGCRHILCSASTLINDSLDALLAASAGAGTFSLVGPSGSGLPDLLFARGVDAVGGTLFDSAEALLEQLEAAQTWRGVGRKYQLLRAGYPGYRAILSMLD